MTNPELRGGSDGLRVVSQFGGPGGSCLGAHAHGLDPVGIEWDDAACATRGAAGLRTVQADVAALDPRKFVREQFGSDVLDGLIGTPPCQAFSSAGLGAGRDYVREIAACMADLAAGRDTRAEHNAACEDPRAMLVVEPLRWALALRPRWIALEQVPPVLVLWEAMAVHLRALGYSVWTGVLSAETFGVPQTRRRAFLIASLDGVVHPPEATHQAYKPGEPARGTEPSLLGPGLLPWVSMAEALGWEEDSLVGFPRRADGPDVVELDGVDYRARDLRPATAPAQALTEKARSTMRFRANGRQNASERDVTEPAPTITAGHDSAERVWVPTHYDRRQAGGDGTPAPLVPVDRPAPTIAAQGLAKGRDRWVVKTGNFTAKSRGAHGERSAEDSVPYERPVDAPSPVVTGNAKAWTVDRPATTVAGDPRVHPPGHKVNAADIAAGRDGYEGRAGENAIRVTVPEAAALQSFPPGFPWQGTRSAQYRQIGDAVPPLLFAAVVGAAIAPTLAHREVVAA